MSAARLREAASLMRERAEAAMDLREYRRGVAKMGRLTPKGQYMSLMSPPVALAVADWLEHTALAYSKGYAAALEAADAFAVADAYLGSES